MYPSKKTSVTYCIGVVTGGGLVQRSAQDRIGLSVACPHIRKTYDIRDHIGHQDQIYPRMVDDLYLCRLSDHVPSHLGISYQVDIVMIETDPMIANLDPPPSRGAGPGWGLYPVAGPGEVPTPAPNGGARTRSGTWLPCPRPA